jgi:chitinase
MHFSTLLAGLGLMVSATTAVPLELSPRAPPAGAQNVVYWGQNGGGTIENNDLSAYCTSTSGINIVVLAFLYSFGNGNNIPSGTIGQSCFISTSGQGQNCANVASSITKCQSVGIKVILSLGGASGSYSLQSNADAQAIGQYLWESYGNSGNTAVQRPFGSAFVNGFDFDIEVNSGSQFYPAMISTLRSNFATDPKNTYYITGAPQCPIPEPNMGVIIQGAQFDYLFVQFYNNNNYLPDPCSLGFDGNAPNNYNSWVSFIATTPSAKAKIFFGVPAAPLAANGAPSGEIYYITPTELSTLVAEFDTSPAFGGIMMVGVLCRFA